MTSFKRGLKKNPKAKKSAKKSAMKAKTKAKKKIRRKLTRTQMLCRDPSGCTKRSMGPRYHFLCTRHQQTSSRPNLRVVRGGLADKSKAKIAKAA